MPIYEYRCSQCGEVFEIMHSMNDESERTCEVCSAALERLISRSSFALKGGGWYKDLYSSTGSKSKSSSDTAKSSSGSDSGSSSGGGGSDSGAGSST